MWSTPWMNPFAIDGAAPSTTTNVMASSVSLNSSTASGNHAIEGMVWRPMISEPTAERMMANRDTSTPIPTPITTAIPKPQMARRSVTTIAVQSSGVPMSDARRPRTWSGRGGGRSPTGR